MKKIGPDDRRIANIHTAEYEPWVEVDGTETRTAILQLDRRTPLGVGFHIYRMEAGEQSMPHEHTGVEQFLVLEGELVENDGTVYRQGDLVWLDKGTQHTSHTPNGCLLAVHIETAETPVPDEDEGA